jgi:hypothetical protein
MEISAQVLGIAIYSTVMERCRLLDRIATIDDEIERDEGLSELVMDIDKALGELDSLYVEIVGDSKIKLPFDDLVKNAENEWLALYGAARLRQDDR